LAGVSADVVETLPHLSTAIDVKPKIVVIGTPSVITVDVYLRNHEQSPVTLAVALALTARAVHSAYPMTLGHTPARTVSLAPGETIREQIELPSGVFQEDTYQFSASVVGYGYDSPPAVIRVVGLP